MLHLRDGCRERRRQRFLDRLEAAPGAGCCSADPLEPAVLRQLPTSRRSASAPTSAGCCCSARTAHDALSTTTGARRRSRRRYVDERKPVTWYDRAGSRAGPRRMILRPALEATDRRPHPRLARATRWRRKAVATSSRDCGGRKTRTRSSC